MTFFPSFNIIRDEGAKKPDLTPDMPRIALPDLERDLNGGMRFNPSPLPDAVKEQAEEKKGRRLFIIG
jgi:hypothetical protein